MMSAQPLFPQSAPSPGGAGLPSPVGEKPATNFGALLHQSAQASSDAAPVSVSTAVAAQPAAAAAPAPSGSFQDLGVILQLLQTSTSRSSDALSEAAPTDNGLAPDAPEQMDAPVTDIFAQLTAPMKSGTPAPQSVPGNMPQNIMPDGTVLPPALAEIPGPPAGKTVTEGLPLPESDAALNHALLPSSELAPPPEPAPPSEMPLSSGIRQPELPVMAADAMSQSGAPHLSGSATARTPALAIPSQTLSAPPPGKQGADAPPPSAPQMIAAPVLTEPPRKAGYPAGSVPSQGAAENGSHAVPSAPVPPRISAAPAASPALPSPVLPLTSAPVSADNGAAMAVLFNAPATGQHPAPIEAATSAASVQDQILDLTSDDGWIDQLARDIAATKSGTGDISFRLMPRHLGRLDIAMIQNDQGISVHMQAQNEVTASIVAAGQTRLVEELRQQGVRVASADVTHSPPDAGRQSHGRDGQGQHSAGKQFIETAPDRSPDVNHGDSGARDPRGRFA